MLASPIATRSRLDLSGRIRDWFARLAEIQLDDLDLGNPGDWPAAARAAATGLVFAVALTGAWFFHVDAKRSALDVHDHVLAQLKAEYRDKARQAAPLPALRQRHADLQAAFSALVETLPTGTEVPGLIEDITRAAVVHDLAVERIALAAEHPYEFYVELPIEITLTGRYHALGGFAQAVATLPRIVTLHDFDLTPAQARGALRMAVLARTYRYRVEEERR